MLVNMVGLYTGSLYWGRGLYSEVYDILLSNVSYLNHTIQDNICPPPTFICSIITIRSTVSDSSFRFKFRFIFRFESETGSIVAYKMWNCSVYFHGINVIRQGHPSSDYCAFQTAIC